MALGPLRVGIVGCGSAGPAAALLLARAGHSVDLFERAPSLGPVGTGFILQPTGLQVLAALGVAADAERHGARLAGLRATTRSGRVILDLDYSRIAPDAFGLGMHRATLLELLVVALRASGARLHLGAEVEQCTLDGGTRRLLIDGERVGPFDLVLIANGARSAARAWLGATDRVRRYPWGAFWTIVPDPDRRFGDRLHQVVDGSHTMLGVLPSGCRSDDHERTPLVSLFWSVKADRISRLRAEGVEALADRIVALDPAAEPIVRGIDDIERWSFAEYLDVVLPRWHGDAIAILGDAGHAMSPQLGQGVNLALQDAWELSACLAEADDLAHGLAEYSRRRRRQLGFYQRATRWLTPFFQSDLPLAASLRDGALPLLARWGFFESQMLASMAGMKDGLISSRPWSQVATRREAIGSRGDGSAAIEPER